MRIVEIYSGSLTANTDPLILKKVDPTSGLTLSQFQHDNGFTYQVKASVVGDIIGGTPTATIELYESIDGTNWSHVAGASAALDDTTAKFIKIHIDDSAGDQLPLGPKLKFALENYDSDIYTFTITAVLCHKEK